MNIIIIGGGSVGYTLAERLAESKNHITLIDRNTELQSKIGSKLDVYPVTGAATDPTVLEEAGIRSTDMIIAVTPYDDTNILCCNFARQYGVPKRIARIKSPHYTEDGSSISLEEAGVTHVIEPENEIVRSIKQYVELPGATEASNFQNDNVLIRGYKITENMLIANKTLLEITKEYNLTELLIVAIIRNKKSVTPTGNDKILAGDEIIAILTRESLPVFRKLLGITEAKLKKVVISGDALTSVHLTKSLESMAEKIVLVDPDEDHARFAAQELQKADVLHGDCTYIEVLQDINVSDASFFIAAGRDAEDNIMAALLAKAEGAQEVIAVTDNERHTHIFRNLGIDHLINPRGITMQKIIANIFKVPIGSLLKFKNIDIEVSRFIARKKSKITNMPLHEIRGLTRKSLIIGCIFRDEEVIIPSGNTVIRENDEVLVICQKDDLRIAEKFFKSGISIEF